MANVRITELSVLSTMTDAAVMPVVAGNVTQQISGANLKTYFASGSGNTNWANIGNINNASGPTIIAIGQNAGLDGQGAAAIAIGQYAGQGGQGGSSITIGQNAGGNIFQGTDAIAIGTMAAFDAQGNSAVAIGTGAGQLIQGAYGIAIGNGAGQFNQHEQSVAIGLSAGGNAQSGQAVAIGDNAGADTQGDGAVAVGRYAGAYLQRTNATAVGNGAGNDTQGYLATAVGVGAGSYAQGNSAVAIGWAAGDDTQGRNAVAIGSKAAKSSQGIEAVAVGLSAGNVGQGQWSVAVGSFAGNNAQGEGSVAVGKVAGWETQGNSAVAVGDSAGNDTQGIGAVAVGTGSGETTQGEYAIAVGYLTGSTQQGISAVAIGYGTGAFQQGNSAVAIGWAAATQYQGANAVAIGAYAGESNQGNNSIIINATGANLDQTTDNTFTVAPIRNDVANTGQVVFYNTSSAEITYGNTISVAGDIIAANFIGNTLAQKILPTIQSIIIANTSSEYETAGGQGYANVVVANVAPVTEYGVIVTAGSSVDKYVTGSLGSIPGNVKITISTGTSDQPFTVYAYVTTNAGTYYSGPEVGFSGLCLLKGTMISLADGTYKPIENIDNDDLLLTWNFDLGCYAQTSALWIKRSETGSQYNLLTFSDGTTLRTIDQHRIFNKQAGAFTYPMTTETPIGTITINEHGQEITLINKQVIVDTVEYYNVITDYHMNLFSDGVLTSCRFNNVYPINEMKFVKDNRTLRSRKEFANIEDRFFHGLRLAEQTTDIETVEWYVNRLLATEATELISV